MPGKGDDKKLSVTKKEFSNRISAYLHQKGFSKSSGKFLREECDRLTISIKSLIELQNRAHSKIGKEEAESIALATYLLIGEILIKTDLLPVERYTDPHPSMSLFNRE